GGVLPVLGTGRLHQRHRRRGRRRDHRGAAVTGTGGPTDDPTHAPAPATVTVAGAGAASAVPDTAVLELGVETRGSTPAEALDACARALDQVLAAPGAEGGPPARRTPPRPH